MLVTLLVVLHVLSAFMLVAGSVGRNLTWLHTIRSRDLATVRSYSELGDAFDTFLVRPGSLLVLLTGLTAAHFRGWPILGFLQGGGSNWVLAALALYLTFIPLIALVFVPRWKVRRRALADATAKGAITPELTAALNDPAVNAGRLYEMAATIGFVWLMIAKPF